MPRRTDWRTGADAGAPLGLANKRVAIGAGISTSRPLLPLPTIESLASPLSRRMIWPQVKLTSSETRSPPEVGQIEHQPGMALGEGLAALSNIHA